LCLAVPFFDLEAKQKAAVNKLMPVVEKMVTVMPNNVIPFNNSHPKKHLEEWQSSEFYHGLKLSPHNII
jgi:hypothetical protein